MTAMNRRKFLRGLGGCALIVTTGAFVDQYLKRLPGATVPNEPYDGSTSGTVKVRIIGPDGKLTAPIEVPKVVKTEAEWRKQLTATQYAITRDKSTEPAFCGAFYDNHKEGIYHCVCCNLPLFASGAKFDSGTGWPSFFRTIESGIQRKSDFKIGIPRTEYHCARCLGHQGHVFDDGPRPTGLRYCNNGVALSFKVA